MIDSLPDILGKNFLIGFFVPVFAASLLFGGILLVHAIDLSALSHLLKEDSFGLEFASTYLFSLWVTSILLMAMNRPIIRLIEGYGRRNPLRLVSFLSRREFDQLSCEYRRFKSLYENEKSGVELSEEEKKSISEEKLMRFSSRYAPERRLLLPTRFGNIMRSIEYYPFEVYGIDSIVLWPRLAPILPKELLQIQDETKSRMDLWVNMFCLFSVNIIVAIVFLVQALRSANENFQLLEYVTSWDFGLIVISFMVAIVSYNRLCTAAQRWGEFFKTSFDTHRSDLAKSLGYELPAGFAEEKAFWQLANRKALYGFGIYEQKLRENYSPAKKEPAVEASGGSGVSDDRKLTVLVHEEIRRFVPKKRHRGYVSRQR